MNSFNIDLNMSKPSIWLMETDPVSTQLLTAFLGKSGYKVTVMVDLPAMQALLDKSNSPDLMVLQSTMPHIDGMALLRHLRQQGHEWPIFMTSASSDPIDLILALEMGADDFLSKPINPRELLARIQACLRRLHRLSHSAPPERYKFGPFVLDLNLRSLSKGKKSLHLTTREYDLLKVLVAHPNQALDRQDLAMRVMGRPLADNDRSLDVQVARLRKIIEEQPDKPRYLQTVWGSGYVFTPGR